MVMFCDQLMFTSSCLISNQCKVVAPLNCSRLQLTVLGTKWCIHYKLVVGCSYMCTVQVWAIILKAANTDYKCYPVLSLLALMMLEEEYFG